MVQTANFRPTLLVGVGGTGAKIAESILVQARAANVELRDQIGILALDTDDNDMRKLSHVPKASRLRFTQPETVFRLLERNTAVEGDWAYGRRELPETILGMSLMEGAGQIRMLTRLALHDSFANSGLLARMEQAIAELTVHSEGQAYDGAIHILVVGSLAGATGSGSFAQVALALKQAARNRKVQATVRGVFLLPDVYVRSGALPVTQAPNVMANGYAALKELNAINVKAYLRDRKTSFSFAYLPGEELREGAAPYEAITFIDYENATGGSMGRNLDAYFAMAARAGYLMIFSPLGARYGSVTVNDVRQKLAAIEAGSTNLYSGIGVSSVSYPVASMKTYLSRKLVLENLRGDWTRLDRSYNERVVRYRQEQAAGQTGGEEPDIRQTYTRDLAQLAKEEPRIPFFRQIYDRLFPEVEDERTFERKVRPQHVAFTDALKDYTERAFWAEDDMARVKSRVGIDMSTLLESDSLPDTVRRAEAELDRDFASLEAALQSRPEDIFQNALVTADGLGTGEWAPHHIQSHIIDGAPHPVGVRALLYHIRDELEARHAAVDPRDIRLKLFRIANVFRTDDEVQATSNRPAVRSTASVVDAANKLGDGGLVGKVFGGKRKAFADEYVDYYNQTVATMRSYANALIASKTYEQALAEINALIRVFEGLFVEIDEISSGLASEIQREQEAYSKGAGFDGRAFVYADAECKEDAWERLRENAQGLRLDSSVNAQLVRSVVEKYREDKRLRQPSSFKQLHELFMREVVAGFGEGVVEGDFASVYDFSVIEAMRRQFVVEDRRVAKEAAERGEPAPRTRDTSERLREVVDRAARQSSPYVSMVRPDGDGTPIKFWTIHPTSERDLNDPEAFSGMFRSNDGDNPIVEDAFSMYELTCVNLRVNLELQHLAKLGIADESSNSVNAASNGSMAKAYDTLVEKVIADRKPNGVVTQLTPHIDRNWHMPGVIPEIFREIDDKIVGASSRAFVISLFMDLFQWETEHNVAVTRFSTLGHGLRNAVDEELVQGHDRWKAQAALAGRPEMVRSALDFWNASLERDSASARAHPAFARLTDPQRLMDLVMPAAVRNDAAEDRDAVVSTQVEVWMALLDELVGVYEASLSPRARRLAVRDHVETARDALFELVVAEEYPPETVQVFRRLFGRSFDQVFAA